MWSEPKIVAEVASNHAGSAELAKEFIRIAAKVGVDYVKFQTYRHEDLVNKKDPQADWTKQTQFPEKVYFELIEECNKNGVKFLTTCFSIKYIDFLTSLGIDEVKVASPDLLSFKMIESLATRFGHLIISTGMHAIKEVVTAIEFLNQAEINATLLHTVSLYPTPVAKAWMEKFFWLRSVYPMVGYSDHVPGIEVAKFAMANGATIIEKHFKLGKFGPGRATPWDATPEEMEELVKYREFLREIRRHKVTPRSHNWLDEGELKARERFIGRWGDNR